MIEAKKILLRGKEAWLVDLRHAGQGRHFFKTEAKAKAFADSKKELVRDYGEKALEKLPHKTIVELLDIVNQCEAAGMTPRQMLAIALEHRPTVEPMDLETACERCVDVKDNAGNRKSYVAKLKTHLKTFRRKFGDETHCHTIKGVEIGDWLNSNDWAQATKKSIFIDVQTLFSFAIRNGWCKTNPCYAVEKIRMENKPPQIFSVAECKRFLSAVKKETPHLVSMFALQLFGGLRASEAQHVKPEAIKETVVEVTALTAKTRQRRLVTINPTLRAWLKLKPKSQQFREPLESEWKRIKTAAKLDWKKNGLRHSFVSYSVPVFGIKQTANEAGHSEDMLFKHYRELVTPTDAETFWKIRP